MCMLSRFSHIQVFAAPWTVARQPPLSAGFSRQESCSGLPFPSPGNVADPGRSPISNISCNGRRALYHERHLGSPLWSKLSTPRTFGQCLLAPNLHGFWNLPLSGADSEKRGARQPRPPACRLSALPLSPMLSSDLLPDARASNQAACHSRTWQGK